MTNEFLAARELLRGYASRADRLFILSKGKALLQRGVAHTSLIGLQSGKWSDGIDTPWDSNAIAGARKPSAKLVIVGEDGDVAVYLGGLKHIAEQLVPAPTAIRNANAISGYVYACGMKRQVYKRVDESKWTDISATPPAGNEAVGFEDIDGFSETEVYAVGWKGEIWQYDGSRWLASPLQTNLTLTAVCCAPNGVVYAGGQQGLLANGRHAAWDFIALQDPFGLDIWDLSWYRDTLYIATSDALFQLVGGQVTPIDFEAPRPLTCYSLSVADDVLWSVGRADVASFDGKKWTVYT